ncbi:MAG: hypothetical protein OXI71_10680 [Gemmatimonadota bacterium]|nr:hypothetical protein [Gemmatimonadota bacterium]MDE2679179.1 hypothetical protein [Gemmatimonadota bacterium]
MSVSRSILCAAMTLVIGAAACGGDPVPPEPELSEQQAIELFGAFRDFQGHVVFARTREPRQRSSTDCLLGGFTQFDRWVDEESAGDTTRVFLHRQTTPFGCRLRIRDIDYALFGSPSVNEQTLLETVGSTDGLTVSGVVFGALEWAAEGRSAACPIELTLTMEPDRSDEENPRIVGDLSGNLCGYVVTIEVSEPL